MPNEQFEYYVQQVDETHFKVAKFREMAGGEQPIHVYGVVYNAARDTGKCDCPAGTYRGTGKEDKHVKMVKQWLASGKKISAIIA